MLRTVIILLLAILSCKQRPVDIEKHNLKSTDAKDFCITAKIEGFSRDGKILLYPDTVVATNHDKIENLWFVDLLFDGKYLMRHYKQRIIDTIAYVSINESYLLPGSKAIRLRFPEKENNIVQNYYNVMVYIPEKGLCGAYTYDEGTGKPLILQPVGDIGLHEIDTTKVTILPFKLGLRL